MTSINLTPASDGAFALPDGPVASEYLHPGEWTTVRVSFNPATLGNFTGTLQFFVSNPSSPVGQVPIVGAAETGCLTLTPSELDFGTVAERSALRRCRPSPRPTPAARRSP